MVITETNSLIIFTQAAQMLVEANTIQKAHEFMNLSLTAADWAKRKGMGEEAIQYAKNYAFDAERKMGGKLLETERAVGTDKAGRPSLDGDRMLPSNAPPTLAELGLTKRESSEAQIMASIPDEIFENLKIGKTSLTKIRRNKIKEQIKQTPVWPSGKYRVIYADPPWKYGNTMPDPTIPKGFKEHTEPTIKGFFLPFDIAKKYAAKVIESIS
jgi:hypothetical protein